MLQADVCRLPCFAALLAVWAWARDRLCNRKAEVTQESLAETGEAAANCTSARKHTEGVRGLQFGMVGVHLEIQGLGLMRVY